MVWKVAGLLVRPKNITRGSKSPRFVRKAAFHSSPSLMWTLLYPHQTLSLVKYCTSRSQVMRSELSGSGYAFFTIRVHHRYTAGCIFAHHTHTAMGTVSAGNRYGFLQNLQYRGYPQFLCTINITIY